MNTKLKLTVANLCQNLMTRAKIKSSSKEYRFHLVHSNQMDQQLCDRLMSLFASLMKEKYENSSWGWNEKAKLDEWRHPKTRIMVVTKASGTSSVLNHDDIIGFMCIRFENGSDKKESVVYVYELHVDTAYQRKGLGRELMRMARALGTEFKLDKIMLTVFRANTQALNFYHKLGFTTDESSPGAHEADYVIMSNKINRSKN